VSERHSFSSSCGDIFGAYHEQGYSIAIDDYGVGFSGLKRLYQCETDYIKIDGFFLADIATSNRKRLFVSHIVGLAHILGIKVVAEQVETELQFQACEGTGCDYVQGFLISEPVLDTSELRAAYDVVGELKRRDKRSRTNDKHIVLGQIEFIEPLPYNASMAAVLEAFRVNPKYTFIPVVNALSEPLGIIWEPDIKEFVYSRYGRELMLNPAMSGRLLDFVTRCPVADTTMSLDKMLEVYSNASGAELLILTERSRYRGFLSASALLVALNEKNLAIARDQNPLSRLPGNGLIVEYVGEALRRTDVEQILVYFDLDNFKVFNDVYGFRVGDRAILLLADTLREAAHGRDVFVGHVGGDDLFAGFMGSEWTVGDVSAWARDVVEGFNEGVLALFRPEDRARGFLLGADRTGVEREFPLLSVSCAILSLPAGVRSVSQDSVGSAMARGKKAAKLSPDKLHVSLLAADGESEQACSLTEGRLLSVI
jgi:GGDEF domain-containing protein